MLLLFWEPNRAQTTAVFTMLTISDGTTTADLMDGTNYALVDGGWGPSVAPLRMATLGGSGPYADVEEQITIDVLGSTGAVCLANLAKLSQLLDQAERWSRGEPVAPVILTCQPQGSVLPAALRCVILGRAGESAINMPAAFNDLLMCYEVPNVQLSFRRRGLWLAATVGVGPGAGVANPGILSATYADSAITTSPLKATLTVGEVSTSLSLLLLWGNAAARLQLVEAETLTATNFTSVADAANHASSTNVLRYTPVATTFADTGIATSTLPVGCRRVAAYARVRNNSSAASFQLKLSMGGFAGAVAIYTAEGPIVTVNPYVSAAKPEFVFLGILSLPLWPEQMKLSISASTTTGPPTLDIDYVAFVDLTDEMGGVIRTWGADTTLSSLIIVDPRALASPTPAVIGPMTTMLAYTGDPFIVHTSTVFALAWLVDTGTTDWCWYASGAFVTATLITGRNLAYLTPQ